MATSSGELLCDAVICVLRSEVQVTTVVNEFQYLMGRALPPLCVILNSGDGGRSDIDFKAQLLAALPSVNPDRLISTKASMPVEGCFTIKRILDSNRFSNFVVLGTDDNNIVSLVVAMDIIFTSAYHFKFKIYGGSCIDIPAILAHVGEDLKLSIKKDCTEYLAEFTVSHDENVEIIKSDIICGKTFAHGFSTRKGGCSSYPSMSSLNLAYNPDKKDPSISVEENRRRFLKAIGASSHNFQLAKAVHGNTVWSIGSPEPTGYDAIVCDKPGLVVAAPAADCVTVIVADATKSVCAAVHSGWKGTLANVIGATIETMNRNSGCNVQDIRAAIGPSIGVCCYEVGEDVVKPFSDHALLRQCIESVQGKVKKHLNLQKALRLQLEDAGVPCENVDDSPAKLCTFCNEDLFFSYQRDGRPFGTHVGLVGLL